MPPRRILQVAAALLASLCLLVAVLVVRATSLPSRQIQAVPVAAPELDNDAIVERFRAALRFRTISYDDPERFPAAEFVAFRGFLEQSFPRLHGDLELEVVSEHTLLFTWSGSDASLEPVVLMGHQDVVPAEPEDVWAHPPFAGELVNGVVWGRGAIDNKANVMAVSEAVEHLLGQGFRPERTLLLAFGHDEELGGPRGAREVARLLQERGVSPHLVVDEGGAVVTGTIPFFERPIAVVGVAEKGSVVVELIAQLDGPAHSSMPPPITPVGRVARAVDRLQSSPFPGRITPAVGGMIDFLAPELPLPARVVAANRWLFGPLLVRGFLRTPATAAMVRTTTAPTMMHGSPKSNVIPPEASITVNFRILTGESVDSTVERVRAVVADSAVEPRTGRGRDPSSASRVDTPGFKTLQQTIAEVFPDAVVAPYLLTAGTDARYFHDMSPSVYRFQPSSFAREEVGLAHGVDERISVDNLLVSVGFFVQLIENAAGPSS
jgi:carboxypeptidase PM20D1